MVGKKPKNFISTIRKILKKVNMEYDENQKMDLYPCSIIARKSCEGLSKNSYSLAEILNNFEHFHIMELKHPSREDIEYKLSINIFLDYRIPSSYDCDKCSKTPLSRYYIEKDLNKFISIVDHYTDINKTFNFKVEKIFLDLEKNKYLMLIKHKTKRSMKYGKLLV